MQRTHRATAVRLARLALATLVVPVAAGLAVAPSHAAPKAATPTCLGKPATIVGTDRADRLTGTDGDDVIVGLGGDDVIRGGKGNDLICGGRGNDKIFGGLGADHLVGGRGNDQLDGGDYGRDPVHGRVGDLLHGGPGNDRLAARTKAVWSSDSALVTRTDILSFEGKRPVHVDLTRGIATGQGRDAIVQEKAGNGAKRPWSLRFVGSEGKDRFTLGNRAATVYPGPGRDVVTGTKLTSGQQVDERPESFTAVLGASANYRFGAEYTGTSGADTYRLRGGEVNLAHGHDRVVGGDGQNSVRLRLSSSSVKLDLGGNADWVEITGTGAVPTIDLGKNNDTISVNRRGSSEPLVVDARNHSFTVGSVVQKMKVTDVGPFDWDVVTAGPLRFEGSGRNDSLSVEDASSVRAHLRDGRDSVFAMLSGTTGSFVDGGTGYDSIDFYHAVDDDLVSFVPENVRVEDDGTR